MKIFIPLAKISLRRLSHMNVKVCPLTKYVCGEGTNYNPIYIWHWVYILFVYLHFKRLRNNFPAQIPSFAQISCNRRPKTIKNYYLQTCTAGTNRCRQPCQEKSVQSYSFSVLNKSIIAVAQIAIINVYWKVKRIGAQSYMWTSQPYTVLRCEFRSKYRIKY